MVIYRKIMEKHLGRKLSSDEAVHHKDRNRKNNDINNLQVMKIGEHDSYHMAGRTIPGTTRKKLSISLMWNGSGAKLSPEDVLDIRKMCRDGIKKRIIMRCFGIGLRTVYEIQSRESWKYI